MNYKKCFSMFLAITITSYYPIFSMQSAYASSEVIQPMEEVSPEKQETKIEESIKSLFKEAINNRDYKVIIKKIEAKLTILNDKGRETFYKKEISDLRIYKEILSEYDKIILESTSDAELQHSGSSENLDTINKKLMKIKSNLQEKSNLEIIINKKIKEVEEIKLTCNHIRLLMGELQTRQIDNENEIQKTGHSYIEITDLDKHGIMENIYDLQKINYNLQKVVDNYLQELESVNKIEFKEERKALEEEKVRAERLIQENVEYKLESLNELNKAFEEAKSAPNQNQRSVLIYHKENLEKWCSKAKIECKAAKVISENKNIPLKSLESLKQELKESSKNINLSKDKIKQFEASIDKLIYEVEKERNNWEKINPLGKANMLLEKYTKKLKFFKDNGNKDVNLRNELIELKKQLKELGKENLEEIPDLAEVLKPKEEKAENQAKIQKLINEYTKRLQILKNGGNKDNNLRNELIELKKQLKELGKENLEEVPNLVEALKPKEEKLEHQVEIQKLTNEYIKKLQIFKNSGNKDNNLRNQLVELKKQLKELGKENLEIIPDLIQENNIANKDSMISKLSGGGGGGGGSSATIKDKEEKENNEDKKEDKELKNNKKGWIQALNNWTFYNSDGSQVKNEWVYTGEKYYYINYEGIMDSNKWINHLGKWYLLNNDGSMAQSEWVCPYGNWYYLNSNGNIMTGWQNINGSWYYLNSISNENEGVMKTGWLNDGENWYYLYESGDMAYNTTINGYRLGFNGAWMKEY